MKNKSWKEITGALDEERLNHIDLKDVFGEVFLDLDDAKKFARECFKKQKTRWMLNRIEWFAKLADHQTQDNVKVFFLIAMAETNIKLFENTFNKVTKETDDVKKFFYLFSQEDKNALSKGFFKTDELLNKKSLKFDTVVDILMNVRHRLAHGKNHYDFRFHNGTANLMNLIFGEVGFKNKKKKIKYELEIKYKDFKHIMVKNAVENIKKVL